MEQNPIAAAKILIVSSPAFKGFKALYEEKLNDDELFDLLRM